MRSIDIHAHLTPQCFWRATANGGDWHTLRREQDARGREYAVVGRARQALPPRARWTPAERLADMDSLGVDVHVLSPYSGFYNYHLDTPVARATATDSNNEIHEMVTQWPDRFAGLGTLPMQDVNAAIAELERIMVSLGFKGAMINDHINGQSLDVPEFLPFWKAAEHLPNTVGNLAERALTFASLVFGGVMDACPDLKICLSHGGGYTCQGIGRLDHSWRTRPEARLHISQPPSTYLGRFYYDCIVYTEPALRYLIDTVGIDRVVFGTDWPYDMEFDWPVSWILSLTSLTQDEKEAILWKNLERALGL
jgi:aminocarboxymuconate-semialdehyde decarboxylase